MIVVSVKLVSAISPTRDKELARVHICNVGGTNERGEYACYALHGSGKEQLDKHIANPKRRGHVKNYPRLRLHVLNLVAEALDAMGYGT